MTKLSKPLVGLSLIAIAISTNLYAAKTNFSHQNSAIETSVVNPLPLGANKKTVIGLKAPNRIANEYIVVFHPKAADELVADLSNRINVELGKKDTPTRQMSLIKGFSGKIPANMLTQVLNHPAVKSVEVNRTISIPDIDMQTMTFKTASADSWGIDRIDQVALPLDGVYAPENQGSGVHAYVIGTGIYTDHNEFTGRADWKFTSSDIASEGNDDDNGHGTMMAGTVGGTIWGVAKDVNLHAVKVLGASGQGTLAGLIEGVEYITNNHQSPAVATMSLNLSFSQALEDAVNASIAAGVTYAVPSGDYSNDACNYSPSANNSAITVAATWSDDRASVYSNHGSCVDIMAPGLYIKSAWPSTPGANNSISHSPMAAAHVAGAAALVLEDNPSYSNAQVKAQILSDGVSDTLTIVPTGSPNLLLNIASTATQPSPPSPPPTTEKTGPNDNIALIGTNGLTASSYSASTVYNVAPHGEYYSIEGAFDGWRQFNDATPYNDAAGEMEKGAAWYSNPSQTDQWIQVDFGAEVSLTGTRILYNNTKNYITMYTTVQSSNDGVNFTDHETYYNWRFLQTRHHVFTQPVVGRYIRLKQYVDRGEPRTGHIHIAELEYYGDFTGN